MDAELTKGRAVREDADSALRQLQGLSGAATAANLDDEGNEADDTPVVMETLSSAQSTTAGAPPSAGKSDAIGPTVTVTIQTTRGARREYPGIPLNRPISIFLEQLRDEEGATDLTLRWEGDDVEEGDTLASLDYEEGDVFDLVIRR